MSKFDLAEHENLRVEHKVAVLIPCYNEEKAIAQVVQSFKNVTPDAKIYVYDNNSSDNTLEEARSAGAIVRLENRRGKGNVVRRMFNDIDADVYLMVDGDGTYEVEKAPDLIDALLEGGHDMVVGSRSPEDHSAVSRFGHRTGNEFLTRIVQFIFGHGFSDMLSGYRVFSRRFVKSFPISSRGFEIETEMTIHALQLGLPITEVKTRYFDRIEGSSSKLSTYSDGFKILSTILVLFRDIYPLIFFSLCFIGLATASLIFALPIFLTYLETGLVPRLPTAILSTGIMLLGFLSLTCGIILDSVSRGRLENKRLHYLAVNKRIGNGREDSSVKENR